MTNRMITYTALAIVASEAAWSAAGAEVYSNRDTIDRGQLLRRYGNGVDMHEVLFLAVHVTGRRDDYAVAWAIAERQRRLEGSHQNAVISGEAGALRELAQAIAGTTESAVLERILGRLSERTQYAVRQQLGH